MLNYAMLLLEALLYFSSHCSRLVVSNATRAVVAQATRSSNALANL